MEEDRNDIIIVGGGIAGSTCALLLARAGFSVLLLERGPQAGSKNCSGGRLYTHSLELIHPGFTQTAPLERLITQERLSLLTDGSMTTLDHRQPATAACSWSVLRARFDPWLMAQAETAGAQCLNDVLVDSLIIEKGRVVGVNIGDDKLYASLVILAEGANTLLAEQHQLTPKPAPKTMSTGVKEILALPREKIEERFGLEDNQGCAWLFAGQPTGGKIGGGFLYTNRDSLSLGVVCNLSALGRGPRSLPQMLEEFKSHPLLRPLLKGAELMEYSAHLIPEGGLNHLPPLTGDGWLLVGDAARLCLHTGHTVRGMDLAVISAQSAAVTLINARLHGYSASALAAYSQHLQRSSLWPLMEQYRRLPEMLLTSPHLFNAYPPLTADLLHDLFDVSGATSPPLRKLLWRHARKAGLWRLLKDSLKGAGSL